MADHFTPDRYGCETGPAAAIFGFPRSFRAIVIAIAASKRPETERRF
jgi:hypothetical protein